MPALATGSRNGLPIADRATALALSVLFGRMLVSSSPPAGGKPTQLAREVIRPADANCVVTSSTWNVGTLVYPPSVLIVDLFSLCSMSTFPLAARYLAPLLGPGDGPVLQFGATVGDALDLPRIKGDIHRLVLFVPPAVIVLKRHERVDGIEHTTFRRRGAPTSCSVVPENRRPTSAHSSRHELQPISAPSSLRSSPWSSPPRSNDGNKWPHRSMAPERPSCFFFDGMEELRFFPWATTNNYFMYSDLSVLATGGGDSRHAFAIRSDFLHGS